MAKKTIKEVDLHVGGLVKKRRLALGLTQEKLAEGLGITFQQVQKYEKGTNRIGSSRLVQIAEILQVSPAFFFEAAPSASRIADRDQADVQSTIDIAASKDGLELIRAFIRLPKAVQRSVAELVEKIAENES